MHENTPSSKDFRTHSDLSPEELANADLTTGVSLVISPEATPSSIAIDQTQIVRPIADHLRSQYFKKIRPDDIKRVPRGTEFEL